MATNQAPAGEYRVYSRSSDELRFKREGAEIYSTLKEAERKVKELKTKHPQDEFQIHAHAQGEFSILPA